MVKILTTLYSKEAINTGKVKHVFLRELKFFKKENIILSDVVRRSHRKVQKKQVGIYFFTAPHLPQKRYNRVIRKGHTKTLKLKFVSFCHKGPEKRG